jgi:hypothetical protein
MIDRYHQEYDLQIKRAKVWFQKASKLSDENEIEIFSKFYFLWSSFNSLYNLELDKFENEKQRIKEILKLVDPKYSKSFFNNNSKELMELDPPVGDEKYYFLVKFKKGYEENLNFKYDRRRWSKIYLNNKSSFPKKLSSLILTIYQIRNNLTHGNKSGDFRDMLLIKNANPLLNNLVKILIEKLEY